MLGRPIERIWCAAKNPIANSPVMKGKMRELERRVRANFCGGPTLQTEEAGTVAQLPTVTEKVLLSSRKQTLWYEDEYASWPLDAAGVPQDPDSTPGSFKRMLEDAMDEELDLHELLRNTGEPDEDEDAEDQMG